MKELLDSEIGLVAGGVEGEGYKPLPTGPELYEPDIPPNDPEKDLIDPDILWNDSMYDKPEPDPDGPRELLPQP